VLCESGLPGRLEGCRQRRWLEKPGNQGYFRGPEHIERVCAWRAAIRGTGSAARCLPGMRYKTLVAPMHYEALRLQGLVLIGLIAYLSDSTLQGDLAPTDRRPASPFPQVPRWMEGRQARKRRPLRVRPLAENS